MLPDIYSIMKCRIQCSVPDSGSSTRLLSPAYAVCIYLLVLVGVAGCTPRQIGATNQEFYASGRAAVMVTVAPPLALTATGNQAGSVPSDINLKPRTSFVYALFADNTTGPVSRHVHAIFAELPGDKWKWEMETWAKRESLFYAKRRTAGKYWTVQTFPVAASGDWFSAMWEQNGRSTPPFWLARRWSTTPEDEVRFVVEYREPLPPCLAERLSTDDQELSVALSAKDLWRACNQEVEEFHARAEQAVNLERLNQIPSAPVQASIALPSSPPDLLKLVGRAQSVDHGSDREYKN